MSDALDRLGTDDLDDVREVDDFITRCEELAESPETQYASDTLLGIAETVRKRRVITAGQRQAVRNIVMGAQETEDRGPRGGSRRYEGWRRG